MPGIARSSMARVKHMNRNLVVFGIAAIQLAQTQKAPTGYSDTPILPGSPWRVHDDARPRPSIVTPGVPASQPASDAVVLFDGGGLTAWRTAKGETPKWKVENGYVEVVKGAGDI